MVGAIDCSHPRLVEMSFSIRLKYIVLLRSVSHWSVPRVSSAGWWAGMKLSPRQSVSISTSLRLWLEVFRTALFFKVLMRAFLFGNTIGT